MDTIKIPTVFKVTEAQFQLLATANRDLRLEQTAHGELIIMPPTGGNTGKRNSYLHSLLYGTIKLNWEKFSTLRQLFAFRTVQLVLLMLVGSK